MKQLFAFGLLTVLFVTTKPGAAQDVTNNKFGKGITVVAQDSSFSLRYGGRIQSLFVGVQDTETNTFASKFLIRRARLKFDGFAFTPRLTYKVELGLSNSDMSGASIAETGKTANLILDAVVKYDFYRNWSVWVGQTKLPGNLERIISSGSLQFVDRSLVNSRYNIDRDAGIQLHYNGKKFRWISSISSGEGRNITVDNIGGYDYTHRLEWLPAGAFASKGELSGADLKREQSPKLMIGIAYDLNDRASRERGQLGSFLSEQRTLTTWFFDAHFKYRGFSAMAEYVDKEASGGSVIRDDDGNYVESFYVGTGCNTQIGYVFKNNFEVAARYSHVAPRIETQEQEAEQYTFGLSRYFVGHALKVQSDITFATEAVGVNEWMYRFQIELSL